MSREWEEVKLGDILELNYGKGLPERKRIQGNIPVYSSAGATGWHNEALVCKEGIVVGRKGTVGSVYYSKKPFFCIDTAYFATEDDTKQNLEYIYYLLKHLPLTKLNTDSAVPGLNRDNAYSQIVKIPPLNEQKAIAHILSTLDEKIETNNQINKTLEKMAQTIFKHWFVEFEFPNENGEPYKSSGGEMVESELGMIPKGWEVKELGDVVEFLNGYAFKSKELLDEEQGECYHVFKMGHIIKGGGLNKSGTKSYIQKDKSLSLERYLIKKGDLLMCMTDMKSNVALLGHTALMDENNKYILNQRVGLIRAINTSVLNYPYLYILSNSQDFIENLRSRANSGVQVNLSTKEIKDSLIIVPSESIHKKYNRIAENLFEKYFNIGQENEKLTQLRNLLLPKLMSGELRVPLEEDDIS